LPTYAVEQLIASEILEEQTSPVVQAIRGQTAVKRNSFEEFSQRLKSMPRGDLPPEGSLPLGLATRRFGGREKPWAHIIAAILDGGLPCWQTRDTFSVRKLMVCADDLRQFDDLTVETEASPANEFISQLDASEILNLNFKAMISLRNSRVLRFARSGKGIACRKAELLELASRLASLSEVSAHLNCPAPTAAMEIRRRGIERVHAGWSRLQLIELGIPPKLTAQDVR
jgi:hypothetical protein